MAVPIKEIALWRREIENQPGALAGVLEPLARAGADVRILMAYRYPGNEGRGAVEAYPIVGKRRPLPRRRPGSRRRTFRRCSSRATTDPVLDTPRPRR